MDFSGHQSTLLPTYASTASLSLSLKGTISPASAWTDEKCETCRAVPNFHHDPVFIGDGKEGFNLVVSSTWFFSESVLDDDPLSCICSQSACVASGWEGKLAACEPVVVLLDGSTFVQYCPPDSRAGRTTADESFVRMDGACVRIRWMFGVLPAILWDLIWSRYCDSLCCTS
jgi:hypothetical protein